MLNLLKKFVRDEEGQDLVEYALLLALIAIASIGAVQSLGGVIAEVWPTLEAPLTAAGA